MFTFQDGPKYWFIRGKVNKTLETIVSIHNKNCQSVTKKSSFGNEKFQEPISAQDV